MKPIPYHVAAKLRAVLVPLVYCRSRNSARSENDQQQHYRKHTEFCHRSPLWSDNSAPQKNNAGGARTRGKLIPLQQNVCSMNEWDYLRVRNGPERCPLWVKSGHVRCDWRCLLYPRKRTCAVQQGCPLSANKRTCRLAIRSPRRRPRAESAARQAQVLWRF